MAFNLKLPNFLSGNKPPSDQTVSAPTIMDAGTPTAEKSGATPIGLLSQYTSTKQLQILGGILLLLIVIGAGIGYHDHRESTFNTTYVATAGEMRMLSQRLAKASSLALQGDAAAFKQLRDSHGKFATDLERLNSGGVLFDMTVPPSPDSARPQLQALLNTWEKTDKNALQMLEMEKNLIALGNSVQKINDDNSQLLDLSEQIIALKLQTNASPREIASASQMVMLTQRIAKNASALLVGDEIGPEIVYLLGKDTYTFRELLTGLNKGSEALRIPPTTDAETKRKLTELE